MTTSACMIGEDVGLVERRTYTNTEPLLLESGASLAPITLAYETYGSLNRARNNVILVMHALSGDAHVAGRHHATDRKPGWWDSMIGPGKAFDTDRYFVLCANVIGGCQGSTGPSSIEPRTGRRYNLRFPVITIVRYGQRADTPARPPGHRAGNGGDRRLDGRDAGAGLCGSTSRPRPSRCRPGDDGPFVGTGHRLVHDRPACDYVRPALAWRGLSSKHTTSGRVGDRPHDRPYDLSERGTAGSGASIGNSRIPRTSTIRSNASSPSKVILIIRDDRSLIASTQTHICTSPRPWTTGT